MRKRWQKRKEANDVVQAQEILQQAYRTMFGRWWPKPGCKLGGALQPLALFREQKVREALIKEEGRRPWPRGCRRRNNTCIQLPS